MTKRNIRSMRFSDRTIEIIEAQVGENFTQKFEALVTRCMWEMPEKERQIKHLDKEITKKRRELGQLNARAMKMSETLRTIARNIESMEKML